MLKYKVMFKQHIYQNSKIITEPNSEVMQFLHNLKANIRQGGIKRGNIMALNFSKLSSPRQQQDLEFFHVIG